MRWILKGIRGRFGGYEYIGLRPMVRCIAPSGLKMELQVGSPLSIMRPVVLQSAFRILRNSRIDYY